MMDGAGLAIGYLSPAKLRTTEACRDNQGNGLLSLKQVRHFINCTVHRLHGLQNQSFSSAGTKLQSTNITAIEECETYPLLDWAPSQKSADLICSETGYVDLNLLFNGVGIDE
jgi:hypothetical protein